MKLNESNKDNINFLSIVLELDNSNKFFTTSDIYETVKNSDNIEMTLEQIKYRLCKYGSDPYNRVDGKGWIQVDWNESRSNREPLKVEVTERDKIEEVVENNTTEEITIGELNQTIEQLEKENKKLREELSKEKEDSNDILVKMVALKRSLDRVVDEDIDSVYQEEKQKLE